MLLRQYDEMVELFTRLNLYGMWIRRHRIANGSGTQVGDVNRLVKQFDEMQKMMKQVKTMLAAARALIPSRSMMRKKMRVGALMQVLGWARE